MNIQDWKTKVLDYNTQLNEKLQKNENAKGLYYGFEVIDGRINQSPEILFIGINPGKGKEKRCYLVELESENKSTSYIDPYDDCYRIDYENGYPLAEFSISILKKLGKNDYEIKECLAKSCVKTNLYHITTNNTEDLKSTLNAINEYKSYLDMSNELCIDLIKTIKPKLVIFEGKGAYNPIVQDCCEAFSTWNEEGNLAYFKIEDLNVYCIGYKRNSLGGFEIEPELVAEKIMELNIL